MTSKREQERALERIRIFEAGKRAGAEDVRRAILDALGVYDLIYEAVKETLEKEL